MRILRIQAEGLPLYKKPFDISFYAVQRVQNCHLQSVHNLFGNIYINTVEALAGINASGKTTALETISFTSMLLSAAPLSSNFVPKILAENVQTVFDIDFFADGKIYHLMSEMIRTRRPAGGSGIRILSEKLWRKNATSKTNKTNLLDFSGIDPVRNRNHADEYLPDDVSIMIAENKQRQDTTSFVDLALFTDFNLYLPDGGIVPTEIISLLDPSIEYITVESIEKKKITRLKFYGQKELVLSNPAELYNYLSSGTVKGVTVFTAAAKVLKQGGYLIVDEIENHFNRELVVSLLRLFMDQKTNPKGAVIIFSTHYPELLDEIDRNDAVFITRNCQGLTIDNMNTLLKRNDIRKSEAFQSNYLGGTAPKYEALLALQKSIMESLEE